MTEELTADVTEQKCGHCGRILDGSIQRCSNDGFCSVEGQPLHLSTIAEMREAIVNLLEIGKRDLTNPKYDEYFAALRKSIGQG